MRFSITQGIAAILIGGLSLLAIGQELPQQCNVLLLVRNSAFVPTYELVDQSSDEVRVAEIQFDNICHDLIATKIYPEQALNLAEVFYYRTAYCDIHNLSENLQSWFNEWSDKNLVPNFLAAHKEFCNGTWRADHGRAGLELESQSHWLRAEEQCAYDSAIKSGEFFLTMTSSDSAYSELAMQSKILCDQLRNNGVDYRHARFRLVQAIAEYEAKRSPEFWEKIILFTGGTIAWVISSIVVLIGVIGTIVAIMVRAKKL